MFVGRAMEKVKVFATTRRRDAEGNSYPWITRASRVVTQWYFYCYDRCAGPFFFKYCGYFPYNAKLCCFPELRNDHGFWGRWPLRRGLQGGWSPSGRDGDGAAGGVGVAGHAEVGGCLAAGG